MDTNSLLDCKIIKRYGRLSGAEVFWWKVLILQLVMANTKHQVIRSDIQDNLGFLLVQLQIFNPCGSIMELWLLLTVTHISPFFE
jgi:hypothetical protein